MFIFVFILILFVEAIKNVLINVYKFNSLKILKILYQQEKVNFRLQLFYNNQYTSIYNIISIIYCVL